MKLYVFARKCAILPVVALQFGCATFTNVRSAQVKDGVVLSGYWTATAELGDEATYMWAAGDTDDCDPCSHEISAFDLSVRHGWAARGTDRAYELGVGLAGVTQLYAEGYIGWNQRGRLPFGFGARVPIAGEDDDYRIDSRLDWRLTNDLRLNMGQGIYYHRESDESWLVGYTPAVGLEVRWGFISIAPGFGWLVGKGHREDRLAKELGLESVSVSVPVISLGIAIHGAGAVSPLNRD